ncbi:MAG TPA: type I 3-dehydroquinate dehydratase [Pseudonocardiaceae bacterium]|nr:type I 3-dehydroquinate dehydratase [Pseudonocardiaceae bacterium]
MTIAERPVEVVATLAYRPDIASEALAALAPDVRCVEVRADLIGDVDPTWLRGKFPGGLIYTLRSEAEGGRCADTGAARERRLVTAAEHYDYVDLEADRDLRPDVLDRIPPERRILTWQGPATDLAGLRHRLDRLTAVGAHRYRLAPKADTVAQALVPLLLLKSAGRDDVVAVARGLAGTFTHVLTARFGAPVVSGWLDSPARRGDPPADGEIPLHRLLADYPLHALSRVEQLYGIIGGSTIMGLSPLVHYTSYRSLGMPALFLPFNTDELTNSLADLRSGFDELGLPLLGATVIRPHKEAGIALATEATPTARRSGSANLLVRKRSGWWADSEADGVVGALTSRRITLADRDVAIIGCGGAGRAAAVGLSRVGARVTLVNRGLRRGEFAAKLLGLPFVPLADFDPRPFSVLVHATSAHDAVLFPLDGLDPATVVFDLNYRATETPLIAAAQAAGYVTVNGKEMLLAELSRQFRLMTGRDMPVAEVSAALGIRGIEDDKVTADVPDHPIRSAGGSR